MFSTICSAVFSTADEDEGADDNNEPRREDIDDKDEDEDGSITINRLVRQYNNKNSFQFNGLG